MGRVDDGIALAHRAGVIFTCFGDMLRVPGSTGRCRTRRRRARTCAWSTRRSTRCGSPRQNPDRDVVFFAIGFETTAPSTALTLKRAEGGGRANFSASATT
jgi:hydrogenase expression/formation protein HypD